MPFVAGSTFVAAGHSFARRTASETFLGRVGLKPRRQGRVGVFLGEIQRTLLGF